MQGYYTQNGYMGLVGDHYMLFVSYEEYVEFIS